MILGSGFPFFKIKDMLAILLVFPCFSHCTSVILILVTLQIVHSVVLTYMIYYSVI